MRCREGGEGGREREREGGYDRRLSRVRQGSITEPSWTQLSRVLRVLSVAPDP